MAYNPYGQAPPYGRPPAFGAPPGMAPPPGMGAPPGMSAPGTAPPGIHQANNQQNNRPTGLPPNFQPPANMPNINFSAPVIRLGTTAPAKSAPSDRRDAPQGRPGLGAERGMDQQRQAMKDNMMNLIPPTKEEIVRTIFIGGITEGCNGDEGMERILSTAGRLRRWDRAMDATGKPCSFGFAQYDDAEGLKTAVEVLKDIEVPIKKQAPQDGTKDDREEGGDEDTEKSKLLIFVDDNSYNYLEKYEAGRGDENVAAAQGRLDAAKAGLKAALYELFHPPTYVRYDDNGEDITMREVDENGNVEVINIPLAVDDELADIPAEMRETVAQEIASFRDRSIQRDMERLKREEEMEAQERARNGPRRPSPPINGVAGANNIPLGPRDRTLNAPSGPKAGVQIPRDYQNGVSFVNGSGTNGNASGNVWIDRADEDDSASDSELEARRTAKKEQEFEKQFLDQERRWLNRERSRTAAVEREIERDVEDATAFASEKEKMASWLKNFDDDAEASKKSNEYYKDRSLWFRNRTAYRSREAAADDHDRQDEERESGKLNANKKEAQGLADSFLDRQAEEMSTSKLPAAPFKLSLGAAAQKAQKPATTRRTVAEVEGLLEDEEETASTTRRTLIPIKFDPSTITSGHLTDEEREEAIKKLAQEIPSDKEGLWKWNVQWDYVDESVVREKLRPFVEKKIVEYLGVQEQLLVEVVEGHLGKRGAPQELVEELEGALDEEAEPLVRKLWRMVIFYSESEKRGYNG